MRRRGWLVLIVSVGVLGVLAGLMAWRPWTASGTPRPVDSSRRDTQENAFTPPEINLTQVLDRANLVEFVCVNNSGSPCKVTITGGRENFQGSASAELGAGPMRSSTMALTGPYTIEAIIVERAGKSQRHEMKTTVPAGEKREVRVNPDDTVEVIPASP